MHYYLAYGLILETNFSMPELVKSKDNNKIDLSISVSNDSYQQIILNEKQQHYEKIVFQNTLDNPKGVLTKNYIIANYEQGIDFAVNKNGKEIIIRSDTELNSTSRSILLNSILAFNQYLIGKVCLHGSAVKIADNKCIAFLGKSGSGKSTMASKFHSLGYSVISDDVLAISFNSNINVVEFAYPCLRLRKNSFENLNKNTSNVITSPTYSKIILRTDQNLALNDKLILNRFFLLNRNSNNIAAQEIFNSRKLTCLMQHAFGLRFNSILNKSGNVLEQFGHLANNSSVFQFNYPDSFKEMDNAVNYLLDLNEKFD